MWQLRPRIMSVLLSTETGGHRQFLNKKPVASLTLSRSLIFIADS